MQFVNLAPLVCLSGCLLAAAACGGKIHYPNYYVLNVPAAPSPTASPKPVFGPATVRELSAPEFLRAGPIVYRPSPEQVGFYEYDRWAVDPRRAISDALVQTLQARGIFQSVHLFDGRGTSDYLITGRLDHLEEVDQGRDSFVTVGLSAQLLDLKTGEVLWRDARSQTEKLERRELPGLVDALSQAADQAVTNLVSSIENGLRTSSASSGMRTIQPQ